MADYDVRISVYKNTKYNRNIATVIFANDVDQLLDADRIRIMKKGNKLYFVPNVDKSVALSNSKLQLYKAVEVGHCEEFAGVYPLEYDDDAKIYYVSLDHKSMQNFGKSNANIPHPSYNRSKKPRAEVKIPMPKTKEGENFVASETSINNEVEDQTRDFMDWFSKMPTFTCKKNGKTIKPNDDVMIVMMFSSFSALHNAYVQYQNAVIESIKLSGFSTDGRFWVYDGWEEHQKKINNLVSEMQRLQMQIKSLQDLRTNEGRCDV